MREQGYPLILVTSGKLGIINHFIEPDGMPYQQGIALHTLIYNQYPLGVINYSCGYASIFAGLCGITFSGGNIETLPILD